MNNLGSVTSVSEFLQATAGVHDRSQGETRFFCRGQASMRLRLRPKLGRYHYARPTFDDDDSRTSPQWQHVFKAMFAQFEQEYVAHHPVDLTRRVDRLTLAQHYGLATPLLDWTLNPLVALYFACEDKSQTEGIVFIFSPWPTAASIDSDSDLDRQIDWQTLRPRRFDQRMVNQDAAFTFHSNPISDFGEALGSQCNGVSIPFPSKHSILRELESVGIHRLFIYPGLESVCRRIDAHYRGLYSFNEDQADCRASMLDTKQKQSFDQRHNDERPPYLPTCKPESGEP